MQHDIEESLDAHSEWVYLKNCSGNKSQMQQSLVTTSEKVYFENASAINREELEKDKGILAQQRQP